MLLSSCFKEKAGNTLSSVFQHRGGMFFNRRYFTCAIFAPGRATLLKVLEGKNSKNWYKQTFEDQEIQLLFLKYER